MRMHMAIRKLMVARANAGNIMYYSYLSSISHVADLCGVALLQGAGRQKPPTRARHRCHFTKRYWVQTCAYYAHLDA